MFLRRPKTRGMRLSLAALLIFVTVEAPLMRAQTRPSSSSAPPSSSSPGSSQGTRPPGAPAPSPQRPPSSTTEGPLQRGTQSPTAPPTSTPPLNTQPGTPGATTAPSGTTNPAAPSSQQQTTPTSGSTTDSTTPLTPEQQRDMQVLSDPNFQSLQPRPVPPLPALTRIGVTSDNTLSLSLNEAIRRALENNNEIEVARNDVRYAESFLHSLEGFYDPVFTLNPQVDYAVRPVTSTLGGADQTGTVGQTDYQLNPGVSKYFQRGGGYYQLFYNNLRQTTTSTFNNLNPIYSSSLGVTLTQPLWRNRTIDRQRRDIRIQRVKLQQSDADFRRLTTEIIARVQSAYWDLVFALRDQQNRLSNVELVRQQYRQTEARIGAGAAAPLERAEVQTELSNRESDLLLANQQVSIAENTLKQLILRDPLAKDWSASLAPTDEPKFESNPVNLQDALTEARNNRQELRRLRLQNDISNVDLQYYRNQTRPRIDVQSTVSTTGLAGTPVVATGSLTNGPELPPDTPNGQIPLIFGDPTTSANAYLLGQINIIRAAQGLGNATIPFVTPQTRTVPDQFIGGYGRMLRNVFGFDTRNVTFGLVIEIPLKNRAAQAGLAGARIQATQNEASMRLQEQTIEVEVRNAAQSLEIARRRILTAQSARENAELQLAGERRLFQVGRSTTFFLFQRENTLANARNLELRAQTDYNKALAELQRSTSTTLRANNIIVQTPTMN